MSMTWSSTDNEICDTVEITLQKILQAGGSGGFGSGAVLQDATGGPPPQPTKPAISFPTGGGVTSQWDVASQTWV